MQFPLTIMGGEKERGISPPLEIALAIARQQLGGGMRKGKEEEEGTNGKWGGEKTIYHL